MNYTGEHLQLLRTIKKIKQPLVAKKLGVKQQAISKLESKMQVTDERFTEYVNALGLKKEEAIKLLDLFTPPRKMRNNKLEL